MLLERKVKRAEESLHCDFAAYLYHNDSAWFDTASVVESGISRLPQHSTRARHPATRHMHIQSQAQMCISNATWDAFPSSATAMLRRKAPPPSEATASHVITLQRSDQSQDARDLISKPLVFLLATHAAYTPASDLFHLSELLCRGDLLVFAADNEPHRPAPAPWRLS
jgi:hypothetical protein